MKKFPFKVKQLDLSKSEKHSHPDIKVSAGLYLVHLSHGYGWRIGRFYKQYEGSLGFSSCVNLFGHDNVYFQFDNPKATDSIWEEVWEILPDKVKN